MTPHLRKPSERALTNIALLLIDSKMDTLMASGQHFRVPGVVIIETIHVLESYYQFRRDEVIQAIYLVIGQAALDFNRTMWATVMEAFLRCPKLPCVDIYLSIDSQQEQSLPLISFDKKLINQMGAVSP